MGFHEELVSSPLLYPIGLDLQSDIVQFIRMTEAAYEAAAFLDRRLIVPGMSIGQGPWKPVAGAAGLPERCHFIFHISHVGSTLLARLLGAHPQLFALREPVVLRTFAEMQLQLDRPEYPWSAEEFDKRLGVFMGLWSRTWRPGQRAIIKATSFVSEMAEVLMARQTDARAVLMYVEPRVFLQALLGGAMVDIDQHAESRLERLHRRLNGDPWRLAEMSAGERVAMSWLCEMLAMDAAAARFPERAMWLDFDCFLASPETELLATMRHLNVDTEPERAQAILAGPAMHRYAKATQFEFDASSRAAILQESQEKHAEEIARGGVWLTKAAERFPLIHTLIETRRG